MRRATAGVGRRGAGTSQVGLVRYWDPLVRGGRLRRQEGRAIVYLLFAQQVDGAR